MARQSAGRRRVDESAVEENDLTPDEVEAGEEEVSRSEATNELWESVRIDVVEIALPKGVGYTLRAYRPESDVIPTDVSEREPDPFPDRHRPIRTYPLDEKAIVDDEDEFDEDGEDDESDGDADEQDLSEEAEEEESADEADDAVDDDAPKAKGEDAEPEIEEPEVPIFLGARGQLYLFHTPEGLVDFVRSGAEHDMSQLSSWPDLVARITAEDVVPLPDDRYELDLVVENLRGGHQVWDPELVIRAGEVARDLGYALQLDQVQASLAPGSPLDDLDEAMRAAAAGGFGGFMARRRLKKIGAEAAPLGWRTIIGKISAAVDWRD